jgi:hypothetical protein
MEGKARRYHRPRKGPSLLERVNPNAAGIDCGSAEHYVALPQDRDDEPVRRFKTFTADLHRLADWLVGCRIETVAMESTSVYWIPIRDPGRAWDQGRARQRAAPQERARTQERRHRL